LTTVFKEKKLINRNINIMTFGTELKDVQDSVSNGFAGGETHQSVPMFSTIHVHLL
jgi:ribosomal protein S6E (S10)